jgi:hypothetical protein
MSPKDYPERIPLEVEFQGKTYLGEYYVKGDILAVSTDWCTTSTQAGGAPASMARQIFREFLQGAKARGAL